MRLRLFIWSLLLSLAFLVGCAKKVVVVEPSVAAARVQSEKRAAELMHLKEVLLMATALAKVPEADRPPYSPLDGDTCDGDVAQLEAAAESHKIPVRYYPQAAMVIMYKRPVVFGIAFYKERTIAITTGMGSCAVLDVLAHELAHLFTPDIVESEEGREVIAELASLTFMRRMGYTSDVDENSVNYLSSHLQGIVDTAPHLGLVADIVDTIMGHPPTPALPLPSVTPSKKRKT